MARGPTITDATWNTRADESKLEAENARLQKALDAVALVREAWTPDERLKLTEKCNKCGKPFPKPDDSLPQNVRELLEEVKTCSDCLEKEMWKLTVNELRKKNAALKSRVAELEKLAKDVLERFILLYEGKDRMSAHARKNEVDRWKMILEKGNHENKH